MALKSAGEKEVNELKKLEDIDIPSPSDGEVLQYNAASKKWVAAPGGGGGGAHHLTHEDGGNDEINVAGLSGELADPQPPKSHKTSHATGGSDALSPADIDAIAAPASPAQGDIIYHNGSVWARLPAGTSGYFLKTQGAGVDPLWAAASGSGDLSWARYTKIGEYFFSPLLAYACDSALALSADRLYAVPVPIPTQMTFDRIAIVIATGATGSMRLGIYNDSGTYPNTLELDAGTVDTGTTGIKAITINKTLAAGLYWWVFLPEAAPSIRAKPYNNLCLLGIDANGWMNHISYYVSQAYGALPATFPGGATRDKQLLGIMYRRSS